MAAKVHYINLGPWPCFVGFTTCEKAFAREKKRLKSEDGPDFLARAGANGTTHFLEYNGALTCIITMEPFAKPVTREQYAAIIAHEAVHVVQRIKDVLAGGDDLGKEAEAYLVQQLVQECLQVAWKSGKERRVVP